MKTLMKTQMRNELIGQAILELIIQKSLISEHTLLTQLRNIKKIALDPVRQEVLQELIAELVINAKKITSGAITPEEAEGKNIKGTQLDNQQRQTLFSHHNHKLH